MEHVIAQHRRWIRAFSLPSLRKQSGRWWMRISITPAITTSAIIMSAWSSFCHSCRIAAQWIWHGGGIESRNTTAYSIIRTMCVQPYFTFLLLSRLTGQRLEVTSVTQRIHGFATWDPDIRKYSVLFWNFSPETVQVHVKVSWGSF